MSYPEHSGGVSRRNLIKSSAIGSLALAAGGLSLPFSLRAAAAAVQQATGAEEKPYGGPARLTAAVAARYACTSATTKWCGWKPIIPATISTAIIRFAPACAGALFAGVSTTPIV